MRQPNTSVSETFLTSLWSRVYTAGFKIAAAPFRCISQSLENPTGFNLAVIALGATHTKNIVAEGAYALGSWDYSQFNPVKATIQDTFHFGRYIIGLGAETAAEEITGVSASGTNVRKTDRPSDPTTNPKHFFATDPKCYAGDLHCALLSQEEISSSTLSSFIIPTLFLIGTLWISSYAYQIYTREQGDKDSVDSPKKKSPESN